MENKIQNEELLSKLAMVETVEELNKVLKENNIALDEGVTAEQFLSVLKAEDNGELGEGDLDEVSGGIITATTVSIALAAASLGISVAVYLRRYRRRR